MYIHVHNSISVDTSMHTCFDSLIASSPVAAKHEELDHLYVGVAKVINEGLSVFERNSSLNLVQLQCSLMLLKAACNNDPCYIDRYLEKKIEIYFSIESLIERNKKQI